MNGLVVIAGAVCLIAIDNKLRTYQFIFLFTGYVLMGIGLVIP